MLVLLRMRMNECVCVSSLGSGEPEEEFKDDPEQQLQMQSRGNTEIRQLDVINTPTSGNEQRSVSGAKLRGITHSHTHSRVQFERRLLK